jgi:subtilisin family serine protease
VQTRRVAAIGLSLGLWGSMAAAAPPDARVIVRPLRTDELVARGSAPVEAARRADAAIRRVAPSTLRTLDAIACRVVRVPKGTSAEDYAKALEATGDYAFVEVDRIVSVAAAPNDPLFASQWHLAKIGAPTAWAITTGDTDLVVAVADSGIDLDHPDLAPLLVAGYNAVDDLAQANGGLVDGLTDHGTEVAGCVAAATDNGLGIAGLCHGVRLMPIRVSNQPGDTAFLSDINAGAIWAADHGATVVNASFTGAVGPTVAATGAYLASKGVNYVWAAGNSAASLGFEDPPEITVVGATDSNDALASFSNVGAGIDLVAPGVAIQTTKLGGLYATPNGTSFASPIVSGALALVRSANPALTPAGAEFLLRTTAKDLGPSGEDLTFGAGRLDVGAAVVLAAQSATREVAPIAVDDLAWGEPVGAPAVLRPLANDVDLNGDALTLGLVDNADVPGSVQLGPPDENGAPTLLFDPNDCFEGFATITYSVTDRGGLSDEGAIEVGVARRPAFDGGTLAMIPGFGSAQRVVAADIDLDGDEDIVALFLSSIGTVSVFRNDGGTFVAGASVNITSFPSALEVIDLVGDPCPDLVVADDLFGKLFVVPGLCGSFGTPVETPMASIGPIALRTADGAPFDFNGDGKVDLAAAHIGFPTTLKVYVGDGAGGFSPSGSMTLLPQPECLAIGDMTGDGKPEIVCVGTGGGQLRVAAVSSAGTLSTVSTVTSTFAPTDLALVDADGDGDRDVVCSSSGAIGSVNGFLVHLNNGLGTLGPGITYQSAATWPTSVAAGDFDADGDIDLVLPHLLSQEFGVFAGISVDSGQAIMPTAAGVPTVTGGNDCTTIDVDHDGLLDVAVAVVTASQRSVRIYRSVAPRTPSADLDGNGEIGATDLGILLGAWGGPDADLNGSGTTGAEDLAILLGAWGGC